MRIFVVYIHNVMFVWFFLIRLPSIESLPSSGARWEPNPDIAYSIPVLSQRDRHIARNETGTFKCVPRYPCEKKKTLDVIYKYYNYN